MVVLVSWLLNDIVDRCTVTQPWSVFKDGFWMVCNYWLQMVWPCSRTLRVYIMILICGMAINSTRHLFPPETHLRPWDMLSCMALLARLLALQSRFTAVPSPALDSTQSFMSPDRSSDIHCGTWRALAGIGHFLSGGKCEMHYFANYFPKGSPNHRIPCNFTNMVASA